MINWKDLRLNPPYEDCDICVKVGVDYQTYKFKRFSKEGWCLKRSLATVPPEKVPVGAMYIILNEIL